MKRSLSQNPPWYFRWDRLVILGLVSAFAAVLVRTAWMSDDAYITLRAVRHFVDAPTHALVYNVGERVQVYTHPLWTLLLAAAYFVTREAYHTPILLSLAISLGAVGLLAARVARTAAAAVLGLTILILSKAFVDYSTSGLENPLTHLMVVAFAVVYLGRKATLRTLFLLSLLSGLVMLNRMDAILLVAPALAVVFVRTDSPPPHGGLTKLGAVALGFLPVLAWIGFATIYYGFPFPNTAYAKLNTGIAPRALVDQGFIYLANSFRLDPLTLVVIGAGVLVAMVKRTWTNAGLALGMLLYVGYTVSIGGDFMSGRFLAAPLLVAVILICRAGYVTHAVSLLLPLLLVLLIGLASPHAPVYSGPDAGLALTIPELIDAHGISDERLFYFRATGWLTPDGIRRAPDISWWAEKAAEYQGQPVVQGCAVGIYGYYIAPAAHIVDYCAALVDPLLARLPTVDPENWRIGHFARTVPDGYLETLTTGRNQIRDPALAEFYAKLSTIVHGELFSVDRLVTIWKMNTGQYDDLLDASAYGPVAP